MNEEIAKKRQAVKKRGGDRGRVTRKDDWLGKQLRELYDDYCSSPLPEELRTLVDRLGRGEDEASGKRK